MSGRPESAWLRLRQLPLYVVSALALTAFASLLVAAPPAAANSTSFVWSGESSESVAWSAAANWRGVSPVGSVEAGLLAFPHLTAPTCASDDPTRACYLSYNDLSGISTESLEVDDGDDYVIGGEQLTLGSGGLQASPASESVGAAGDEIETPIRLSAPQTWHVEGRAADSPIGENGLLLAGSLSGSSPLTVDIDHEPVIYLAENETEVGPVDIAGTETGRPGVENGFVALLGADVNAHDGEGVNLGHILVLGSGTLGPLTTEAAELSVGNGDAPSDGISAASVQLDSASDVSFEIAAAGTTSDRDYSQLSSRGSTALAGATLEVVVRPPAKDEPCPTLAPGETYTFVSGAGTLSGSFANAPEGGDEIPIRFGDACTAHPSQTMRIAYHRAGTTQTVTGTVEEEAFNKQEEIKREETKREGVKREEVKREEVTREEETRQRQEGESVERHAEESSRQTVEAALAAAKQREEAAGLASQVAATQGVAAFQAKAPAAVPDALLDGVSLPVSASGRFNAKISCPAGEGECVGTVTFRTAEAVRVAAKGKPAILTLASGSFTVLGGSVKTITLNLSTKARALLTRLRMLATRATILAHDQAGASHTGYTIAQLRLSGSRHRQG